MGVSRTYASESTLNLRAVEVCAMEPKVWKWRQYYWALCRYLGEECYRTWRQELLASVIVILFTLILTGEWKDFRTALLATACTLGAFAVWHLLRIPWLLHRSVHRHGEAQPGILAGIFGMVIVVAMLVGGYELALYMWKLRPVEILQVTFKVPAPTVEKAIPCQPNDGPAPNGKESRRQIVEQLRSLASDIL